MKTLINHYLVRFVILSLLLLGLASCGGAPKKHSLQVRISATTDVNPDLETRPSPVILHILELTAIDEFNRADYFALTEKDASALGGDVLNKTEIILTPGSAKETALELDPRNRYALRRLTQIYERLGRPAQAETMRRRLLEVDR